jgi:hypothetical protein
MFAACLLVCSVDVTYHKDVAPILKTRCIPCHSDTYLDDPETSGGLSLSNPAQWMNHSNKRLVVARNVSASVLFGRLITKDRAKRMPKDDEPLSEAEEAIVKQWIEAGLPMGTPEITPRYRRRESKALTQPTMTTVPFAVLGPGAAFKVKNNGPLSLVAPLGPASPITAVAISPNGHWLAAGSFRRLAVWDLRTGALTRLITDMAGSIHRLEFSKDSSQIWLAGGEPARHGEARGYTTTDWKLLAEIPVGDEVVTAMALRPDGKQLAVAGLDRMIRTFDSSKRTEQWKIRGHSDAILALDYSPDGTLIASAGKDKSVKIWKTDQGTAVQTITGATDEIFAILFSQDGSEVFSGGKQPQLRRISLKKGNRVNVVGAHGIAMTSLCWSADRSRFASAGADRVIRLWRPNGTSERVIGGATDLIYSVALSPKGDLVAGAIADGSVSLWNTSNGRLLAQFYVGIPRSNSHADWLTITSHGFFQCSKGLLENSHWLIGTQQIKGPNHPAMMTDEKAMKAILAGEQVTQSPFFPPSVPSGKTGKPKPPAKKPGT